MKSRYLAMSAAGVVTVALVAAGVDSGYGPEPAWSLYGGAGVIRMDGRTAAVSTQNADEYRYVPGTSILQTREGLYRVPGQPQPVPGSPEIDAAIAESRRWLAAGTVPGSDTQWRDMAERALLDLRALSVPSGGVVAAWHGPWAYVWPRDASFVAAAFCVTGHGAHGARVLDFLAAAQRSDGTWAARYHPSGRPVTNGRRAQLGRAQLDATGWVPWAAWLCATTSGDKGARHWPMVRAAADAASHSLADDGLPPESADYWEIGSGRTLGTAAPLLTGLRAATDLATALGHPADARRYEAAAQRLAVGIQTAFGASGYRRTPDPASGHDAAIAFLAPPFGAKDATIPVGQAAALLSVPNGGLKPGENWGGHPDEAWTPETGLFALAAASSGDTATAARLLDWLNEHRTVLGALPERVSADGHPVSVAPLAWTAATTLLVIAALDGPLPVPGSS